VGDRPLGDLVSDPHDRVQCRHRFLEDDPYRATPNVPELVLTERDQVFASEEDLTRRHAGAARKQSEDRTQRHALAASRFADQTERLAFVQIKGHAVDRVDDAAPRLDLHVQVSHGQESLLHVTPAEGDL
jgi:hypothetical protein